MCAGMIAFIFSVLFAATPALAQGTPSPDTIIKRQDQTGDGRISRQEWAGPPHRFEVLDLNSDGYLTKRELEQGIAAVKAARAFDQPLIDVHTHIGGYPSQALQERVSTDYSKAVDQAIQHMDRHNVRTSVVMDPPAIIPMLVSSEPLFAQAKRYQGRFAVLGGGGTLNPIIQRAAPEEVTPGIRREFEALAEDLLKAGAIGFGEIAALHFSFFKQHPFEDTRPDHPLLLLLADIAARHDVPIDLHCELVAQDRPVPKLLVERGSHNPQQVHSNIAALERLLAHNPKARIILSHSSDATGDRTAEVIGGLMARHPNLLMSLNVLPQFAFPQNLALRASGPIKPEWVRLIERYPDRFLLGSDQFYRDLCPSCKMIDTLTPSLRWLQLLPSDLSRRVALDNPRRVFKLR